MLQEAGAEEQETKVVSGLAQLFVGKSDDGTTGDYHDR